MNIKLILGAGILSCLAAQVAAEAVPVRNIRPEPVMLYSTARAVVACPDPVALHEARLSIEADDFAKFAVWATQGDCVLLGPGSFGIGEKLHANRLMEVHFSQANVTDIQSNTTAKREDYGPLWVDLGNLAPLEEGRPRDRLNKIWDEAFAD